MHVTSNSNQFLHMLQVSLTYMCMCGCSQVWHIPQSTIRWGKKAYHCSATLLVRLPSPQYCVLKVSTIYIVIYQNITHLKTPNNDIHLTSVTYAGTKWGKKAHILTLHTPHTLTLHPPSYPHTRPFLLLCSWGCPQRTPHVTQIHTSWVLVWERM